MNSNDTNEPIIDINADKDLMGKSLSPSPTPSDFSDWDLEVVDSISGSSEDAETMDEVNDVENDKATCPASDDKSIPSEDVPVISGSSKFTFVERPAVGTSNVDEGDDDSGDAAVFDSVTKSSDSETFNDILKKLEQRTDNSSDSSSDGWFDKMMEEAPEIEDSPLLTKELKVGVNINDEIIQSEIEDVEHEPDSNVFELEMKPKTEISDESSEGCELYKIIERSSKFPVSDGCNISREENVDTTENKPKENSGASVVNESPVSKETENDEILVTVTTETTCQLVKHPDSFDDCQAIKSIIDRLILEIIVDTTVSESKRENEPTVTGKTSRFESDREIGMSSELRNDPKVADTLPKYKAFSNDEKIKTSEPTELATEKVISVDKPTESTAELDVLSNTEMEGSSLSQVMDSVLTPVKSIICEDLENKAVVESDKEIECLLPAEEELNQNLNTNGTDILTTDQSFRSSIHVINAKPGDPKSEDSDNNSLNVSEVDNTDSSHVIFSEAVAESNDNSSLFPIIESISSSEMAVSNVDMNLEEPDVPDYSPKRKLVDEADEMPNKKCKLDIIQPPASKEHLDKSKEDHTSDSHAIDQETCDVDCEVDNSIEPPKEGSDEVFELYDESSNVLIDVNRLKNASFFTEMQNSAISNTNFLNCGWRMKAETLFSQNFTDSNDVKTMEPATLHSQNDNSTDSDTPLLQKDMLDDIIQSLNSPKASTSNSDSEHQPVDIDKMAPCSLDTEIPSFNKEAAVESTKERDVLSTEVEAKGDTESDICVIQEKAAASTTESKQEKFNKDNYLELRPKDLSRFFDELVSSVFNRVFSQEILAAETEYRAASDALRKIAAELDEKIQQICKLCDKQKAMFEHFNYKPVIERRNVGVNVRSVQPRAKKVLPKTAPVQRPAPKFVGQPQVPINPLQNAKPIIISSPRKPLIRCNVKNQMLSTPASANAQIIRGKIPPNATVVRYPVPNTRPALPNGGKVPASFQLPPGSSVIYRKQVPTAPPRPRTVVPTAGQAKLCLSPTKPGVTSFGIQVPRLAGNVMPMSMQYFPRMNTNTALIPSNMAAMRSGPNTRFVVLSSQGPQFRVLTQVAVSNMQKLQGVPTIPAQRPQSIPVTPTVSQSISKLAINPNQSPPRLPRAPFYPENPAFKLLPPKPLFGLSKKTDGIHLTWNLNIQAGHEEIAKYELYAYQENEPAIKSDWRNIGDIKAMALPMACTLTQFIPGHRYYFAVRAVDRYGRAGEFSDPQNIKITV